MHTIVTSFSGIKLAEQDEFVGFLVTEIIPFLSMIEMNLAVLVHITFVQHGCFSQVLIDIDGPGIAEPKRPVLKRSPKRFPYAALYQPVSPFKTVLIHT